MIQWRRLIFLSVLLCTLAGGTVASAAPSPDAKKALNAKVAALMPLLAESKYDALLQQVGMTSDPDKADYDEQRATLSRLADLGGKYSDFEIVGYKSLGNRFQTVYVMAYYERLPVLFEFSFYDADSQWHPLRLHVDLTFKDLLDTLPLERP